MTLLPEPEYATRTRMHVRFMLGDVDVDGFLRLRRAALASGGETWIGFNMGLICRALWHISRGEQVPGWWGWSSR